MHAFTVLPISTKAPSPLLELVLLSTSRPTNDKTWHPMVLTVGMDGPYRCHKGYIPTTFRVRDALTVDWFPHKVPFPKVGTDEYLRQTATDMLTLLQGTQAQPLPSLTYGSPISNAYIQIAKILKQATALPLPMNQPETLVAPPVPEQRVPIVHPPALKQRVQPPSALPLLAPSPNPPNSVATKKALPQSRTGLPRQSRRTIRPPSRYAHKPLAQSAVAKPYAHHTASLITTPPTAGKQGSIKKLLRGPDATIWEHGLGNEWGRLLSHGLGLDRSPKDRITGTGTVFFIARYHVPPKRKVTCAIFVCNIRPQKTETHRVQMTAGSDKLDYPSNASSPTASMMDSKLHINSTISDFFISDAKHGARHLGLDIKNYFLGTPMAYFQYMRVPPSIIPREVWNDPRYDIRADGDGYVYLEIWRSMYGLKEAAIIAFNQLVTQLAPAGYKPAPFTPGIWRHHAKKTTFVLCVDGFGVKHFSKSDTHHLIDAIKAHYKLTINWSGSRYCGLTSIGNTTKATLTFPCLAMSIGPSKISTTFHLLPTKMPITGGSNPSTAHAGPRALLLFPWPLFSTSKAPTASNR
jgi:hypothetical protein